MSATLHRRALTGLCLSCVALITLLYLTVAPYRSLETAAGDWLSTNPAARLSPRNPQLVYLGIGPAAMSLDTLWPEDLEKSPTLRLMKAGWPWNRAVHAATIDRLVGAGAKAVVFDMVVPGPRAGDAAFRAALDKYADRVVIGSNLEKRLEDGGDGTGPANLKRTHILPSASLITHGAIPDSRIGFVNVLPDADGKIRRTRFRTTLPEFFDIAAGKDEPELFSLPARALQKGGFGDLVPKTRKPLVLRYSEEFLPLSIHEIFVEDQWTKPPYRSGALFKDKIVLIGATGNAAEDRLQTPFGTALGPTIHLSAINAALNRDFIHETPLAIDLGLIALGGGLAWILGATIRRPLIRLAVLFATLAGCYGLDQLLFNVFGLLPILVSPMLTLASSGMAWSAWEQVLDLRDKARLRRTFERYVSRDVVKELVDNPAGWLHTVGGARKSVTVLFSDIRGFTTLTESAEDPHALVAQLNEYFDEMVQIVFANNGTLDKFIGDAVMAHWGSITSEGEAIDALRAVSTAVEMRETLARLNRRWKQRGQLELNIGIGVNYGEAIVGNLGCEAKMEFTMIGDAVNLGSRLEGVTKSYNIDVCLGEHVAPFVREEFQLRSLDLIVVKGKTKPVEIFTVLGRRLPSSADPDWLAVHEEAMRRYRLGEFKTAAALWREVLAQAPGDPVSAVFLARCLELQKEPPNGEWTGVFEMKSK
ncbi:MAG: adenylate/guanylate cyclase domain-containing protein [Chthoniobacteraceae bacterium]